MSAYVLAAAAVLSVSAAATWSVRWLARQHGWLAPPRPDRWHRDPTALFGGIAMFAALALGILVFVPLTPQLAGLLALTAGMFAVGLADDIWDLRPQTKLVAQLAAGLLLYRLGFHFNADFPWLLDLVVVVFWVVALTNAMNLLDNMNGLCAGTAAIAALFRCLFYLQDGNHTGAMLAAVFFGAVLGFLLFNFPRASIFMGDSGSFVLGFFLAAINLTSSEAYSKGLFSILFFPVLVLALPIFDTAFVSMLRWFSGRAISQGGKDHTSHRLVAVGLSETSAVLILYGVSFANGTMAFLLYRVGFSYAWFLAALAMMGLVLFGVFLASVKVYPEDSVPWEPNLQARGGFALPTEFRYKRLLLWVLVDTVTILLAWYVAFLVRYSESPQWPLQLERFMDSAPLALLGVLVGLFGRGLYRTDWQHFSLHELRAILTGTALGLLATFAVLAFIAPGQASVTVFIVAFAAEMLMLAGTRAFVRMLADSLRHHPEGSERVLIYGAGVGGELALRELRSNTVLGKHAVGFIDDDPFRRGMTIHGVPVLGGLAELERLIGRHRVTAVLVSTAKLTSDRAERLASVAQTNDVTVYRLEIRLVAGLIDQAVSNPMP